MKLLHEYPIKIFKNEYNDRIYYKLGLSRKDQDKNTIYGSIECKFRKDAQVDDSKKIYIQDAWLDFYVKDKITRPYIFINKFDYVSDIVEDSKKEDVWANMGSVITDDDIIITDDDLPF